MDLETVGMLQSTCPPMLAVLKMKPAGVAGRGSSDPRMVAAHPGVRVACYKAGKTRGNTWNTD